LGTELSGTKFPGCLKQGIADGCWSIAWQSAGECGGGDLRAGTRYPVFGVGTFPLDFVVACDRGRCQTVMNPFPAAFALLLQAQASPVPANPERFWNLRASDIVLVVATVVTSGLMIWAVVQAPKWAVRIQWELQLRKEERDRRLNVFKTLMATRATTVDFRHVQALNMIDVEFSSTLPEDAAVRGAWREYLDALNDKVDFNGIAQVERRHDLLAELLQRMGRALGYDFTFAHLKGRPYYPQGHEDDSIDNLKTRKAWLEIVEGNKPLRMEVVRSEVDIKSGADLIGAWLEVAEGKRPLRIEMTAPPDKAADAGSSS